MPKQQPPVPALAPPSEEYSRGQRDGLRLALAILGAEEARWAAVAGASRSARTNTLRVTRLKAFQVAQKRVSAALKRLTQRGARTENSELAALVERLGL